MGRKSNSIRSIKSPKSDAKAKAADDVSSNSQINEEASLYEQLGGDAKMKLFIDYFLDGIMADQDLSCYHEKFKDPDEMDILKYKLLHFFKWKLDGAPFYIGKSMYEAHKNLGISDEIFDKASAVFASQLRRIKPKLKVFREFIARVGAMRHEIVIPLPEGQSCPYGKKCD